MAYIINDIEKWKVFSDKFHSRGWKLWQMQYRWDDENGESSLRGLPLIPIVAEYLKVLRVKQLEDKLLLGNKYSKNDYVCKYTDGRPVNITTLNHIFKKSLQTIICL